MYSETTAPDPTRCRSLVAAAQLPAERELTLTAEGPGRQRDHRRHGPSAARHGPATEGHLVGNDQAEMPATPRDVAWCPGRASTSRAVLRAKPLSALATLRAPFYSSFALPGRNLVVASITSASRGRSRSRRSRRRSSAGALDDLAAAGLDAISPSAFTSRLTTSTESAGATGVDALHNPPAQ